MENQAHHELAYANMFEQQYGPPPPPVPDPTPTPTPAPEPVFPPPIPAPVTDMAIAVQTRDAALIAQMQMMIQQMMSQNTGGGGRNYQGGRGRSGGRGGRDQRDNQDNNRNNTARTYCWSHSACAYNGSECSTKATGHKNEATFANMMGGTGLAPDRLGRQ